MRRALIVFAHGSRDPLWVEPLRALQARIRAALPGSRIELAFLEFVKPSLAECVETLWQEGCREFAVLPAFVAAGAHLRAELPQLIEQARAGREGLAIRLMPALGDMPEVQAGVVDFLRRELAQ